jgi:hypothetical protein
VTILSDPAAWISGPVSCDNDRWIALNWMVHGEGSGNQIWRANPDGSGAVPLTSGEFGSLWGCSPDGKSGATPAIVRGLLSDMPR